MYVNLKAELVRKGITIKSFSEYLNLSQKNLTDKLNEVKDFTLSEIKLIIKLFPDLDYEYLFHKA